MKRNESGNVIFYVLIAVGLLAALSYSVSQSMRGGVGTLSTEQVKLAASEIIGYGNIMSKAVAQARLRDYSETEISFENTTVAGYANADCMENECEIFNITGGGVSYMAPKPEWLDTTQAAQLRYGELYFNGSTFVEEVGTSVDDLVMFIPYLKKDVCMAINDKLGINPPSSDTPVESAGPVGMSDLFTGTYDTVSDTEVSGGATPGNAAILHGTMAGCTESAGGGSLPPAGTYHFYQVLIAR